MRAASFIKKTLGAMALVTMLGQTAMAGLNTLEIKGMIATNGYSVNYDRGANRLAGRVDGTDSVWQMDGDLDFKMMFFNDVSARLDLEFDNSTAGENYYTGHDVAGVPGSANVSNRFAVGVDQAYVKMDHFLFKNFSLTVGKQNFNISLRDNDSYSWAFGDPVGLVGAYSTRDLDIKGYFLKYQDTSDLRSQTNDNDSDLTGLEFEYWLSDDKLLLGYLNYASKDGASVPNNMNIIHYGLGLDYFIGESIELYAEVAGQSIDSTVAAADGSAFMFNLGAEYTFSDFEMRPRINLDYLFHSGANNSGKPGWQNVAGETHASDAESLFVEGTAGANGIRNQSFGIGLNNLGYSVIRLNGWISPTRQTQVGLGIHLFTDENDRGTGLSDDMGMEIDLTGSWNYTPDVAFRAGAFLWTGAEADAAGTLYSNDIEDVYGFMAGTTLKF